MPSGQPDTTILIAEDDEAIRYAYGVRLQRDGYTVTEASNGPEALHLVGQGDIDLVVLDIGLPGLSGLDVLTRLRRELELDVPVIVITGHDEEEDRVRGLELGADAYVGKPVTPRELSARVRAVLRRANGNGHRPELTFRDGLLRIDVHAHEVFLDDEPVQLTAMEFDLLVHLAGAPRRVLSREQLLNEVWDSRSEWQDPATVTEHVRRLRLKLDTDEHGWIDTVRGAGYRFEP